jgi:CHU_C Type IX secretion signal domain
MKILLPMLMALIIIFISCKNSGDDTTPTPRLTNCDGLITDTLGTNDNGRVYMPTAFTPNNDGKNDIIRPTTRNVTSITYTLYDLSANIVFTTNQLAQGWSAPPVPPNTFSTYYYKIQATTASGKKIGACGEVYNINCYPSSIPRANIYFEDQLRTNGFTGTTTEVLQNCQ